MSVLRLKGFDLVDLVPLQRVQDYSTAFSYLLSLQLYSMGLTFRARAAAVAGTDPRHNIIIIIALVCCKCSI